MVDGRGTQHVISEVYIFLVGRKVTKNVRSIRVLTLCRASTLLIRGTNYMTQFNVTSCCSFMYMSFCMFIDVQVVTSDRIVSMIASCK